MRKYSCLFLILLISGQAFSQANIKMPVKGLCAHRGDMSVYPENTMPAFQHAIDAGAQMIEFDIQLSKDNVLVIMHDATVDRTTNGKGAIADLTLSELQKIDAGVKTNQRFASTKIPTLEETLDMMPQNIWLNCHLKGEAAVGKSTAEMLVRKKRLHQAFLACGEEAAVAARAVLPSILICNAENKYRTNDALYVGETVKMKANFIQLVVTKDSIARKPLVNTLKENNVKVNYFFAKSPDELTYLFGLGVDFVLVNDIDLFKQEAARLGIVPVKPVFKN